MEGGEFQVNTPNGNKDLPTTSPDITIDGMSLAVLEDLQVINNFGTYSGFNTSITTSS